MVFSTQRAALMLALSLVSAGALAASAGLDGDAPSLRPASDAVAPSSALPEAKVADPIAADALKIEAKTPEAAPSQGLPPAAKAYASADPEAAIAFPLPDAAVSPAAPVPEVVDPARAAQAAPDVDLPALRQAIDAYRKGRVSDGDRLRDAFADPAARALLEWVAIRAGAGIGFDRTVAFTRSNPDWPAGPLLRRRAEEALLTERRNSTTVRAFFAASRPASRDCCA
jgi:soluble lytic murein transglycosylase